MTDDEYADNCELIIAEYLGWLLARVDDKDMEPLQNHTYQECLMKFKGLIKENIGELGL
jgi:hypothetical protein